MKPEREAPTQQVAVWYFVAATFVFAAPAFAGDVPVWVRVGSLVVGFALVVGGGFQLGRELGGRRKAREADRAEGWATDEGRSGTS